MTSDIGIDLGTTKVMVYIDNQGIVLTEPSVVAVNTRSGDVLAVGEEAFKMIGRTPDNIRAIQPLKDGVISDYEVTEQMIKYFVRKVCKKSLLKPRVAVCVPSGITGVESRAVIDAAVMAGARKVFLIEEPIAAAIGAGIDITKPSGTMIVDVGGGTADIGVISLSGIVVKTSIKMAGNKFDQTIIRYVKNAHNILIGEKTAQIVKETVGCAFPRDDDTTIEVKGRSLLNGLPQKITLTWQEIYECLKEPVNEVVDGVKLVLEKTPPELVGDIAEKGIVLTGGGSLLWGFDKCIAHHTKIGAWVAENARECVAIGTGKSFQYIGEFFEGFVDASAQF